MLINIYARRFVIENLLSVSQPISIEGLGRDTTLLIHTTVPQSKKINLPNFFSYVH